MFSEIEDPFKSSGGEVDNSLNHRECPHCLLWFRLDEARPAGEKAVRCPNCGWKMQRSE